MNKNKNGISNNFEMNAGEPYQSHTGHLETNSFEEIVRQLARILAEEEFQNTLNRLIEASNDENY